MTAASKSQLPLFSAQMTWRRALTLALLPAAGVTALYLTTPGHDIEISVVRPIELIVLQSLDRAPLPGAAWPTPLPHDWALVPLAALVGAALGRLRRGADFGICLLAALLVLFGGLAPGVAYLGAPLPWLFCAMSLFASAILVRFGDRRLVNDRARRLRASFEGAVSPANLQEMLDHSASFLKDPTGKVVTVMYVRIVGFSVVAERQTPKEAFVHLREVITSIEEIVRGNDGIVQRTMGDGLLCFFGCQHTGAEATRDHADRALRSAIKIQKTSVARALEATSKGLAIYPLRIGINSTSVYIGDLGTSQRIEMTVIGAGVNTAMSLEGACDSFGIVLTPSTRDILVDLDSFRPMLRKRSIQLGLDEGLFDAYECDPFFEESERVRNALAAYRKFAVLERKDTRWAIPEDISILVTAPSFSGRLVNFSENGIGATLDRYLGQGAVVRLSLESDESPLASSLNTKGLLPIVCEVRWSRPAENGQFLSGLLIKSLDAEQKKLLMNELRDCLIYAKAG